MDSKSRYGTNRILKDRNVHERNDFKHTDDDAAPDPCVSPNDDGELTVWLDLYTSS